MEETAAAKTTAFVDDFLVDEFLDFSNGFSETEEQTVKLDEQEEMEPEKKNSHENQTAVTVKDDFGSLPVAVHAEEGLESLEWLSHFVEDSFSDYPLTGKVPPPVKPVEEQPCFTTPVQTKARTKRARTGVRVWPVLSPESSTSSSSSSTAAFHTKKQRRKLAEGAGGVAAAQPRRCTHCGVTKTPQWRAGPSGSKTLCNACGVRFKSGRLLPEYRPACSPTFSSELHSNNHRKVMEMRRQREAESETAGLARPVQSF
ncbi:hypothetical protein BUALT_Bualt04G0008700 [Buddleja alternifolia]|uniref:GATA transcription factor n=1 Tax=Buddleja alternifolia TaxID=168488 RepID=A0AAV6XWK0_9LAMI|nr:hypothetical protein BUALT_Bualt04G0008700 [Buddleja alternifolia]